MPKRTDTAPKSNSDTLGIPAPRPADDEPNGCAVCHGRCAITETVLFWCIGEKFFAAHPDCALPPMRVPS